MVIKEPHHSFNQLHQCKASFIGNFIIKYINIVAYEQKYREQLTVTMPKWLLGCFLCDTLYIFDNRDRILLLLHHCFHDSFYANKNHIFNVFKGTEGVCKGFMELITFLHMLYT